MMRTQFQVSTACELFPCLLVLPVVVCCGVFARGQDRLSPSSHDSHNLSSQWQAADTVIKVLLPDRIKPRHKYRTLYVLPVESGETTRWGDSIAEILKHNLHNSCQLICVFPTFADLPWYADHPTDVHLRQETYLMRDVVPLIEAEYLVRTDASDRLLVGFSKSGWGAWSLLLRHPDVFGRAAAFDAPLMMGAPGKYGSGPIFGTPENFFGYQISRQLKPRVSELRRSGPRLALFGKGNFQKEHQQVSQLLQKLQIPCYQEDSTVREHSWHSGWLPLAVRWLAAP